MSVTIDSLDIQIRSSAGSAKQNIEELAKALEKLNGQAKVTKIVNALERLNGALTNLRSNSGVMGQLTALSKSLERLASLPKLTGLQSAITQLKRLPQVINDLDAADIAQFTLRLRQLSNALTPLATQLSTIGTAFNRLPASIRRIVTGVNQLNAATHAHSNALGSQSLNLMATIQNLQDYMSMIHFVGDAISRVMGDAIEWDGIQFRFGRAFGEDAEEVYAYAQKVSDVLKINIQQFMQYSSLYGSLLSGFGMTQEKITTISVGLTELSYDIWAAYNDRFKTLEDASEAVRSAITGEIEPIRNAGIALTEASLQEYLEQVGMASVSIEKLSEAQKSEVRYAAMVNAAMNQGIVGTYAREMQTAEGAVRTLSQQMKTLGQSLGSLFLPILQVVVPYLNAFVELIYEGVVALAALLGIPFQKITWDTASAADGVGSLAESADDATGALGSAAKAAKKLKSYTMGFDELNIIDPSSDASGGGSGGAGGAGGGGAGWGDGLDLKTLWDDSVFASASQQVDELKQKVKDFYKDWMWQIEALGAGIALMGLGKMVEMLKEAEIFSGGFLKNMNTISKIGLSAIVITLQWTLVSEFLENFIETGEWQEYIKAAVTAGLGTWALGAMWGPTGVVIGLGITAAVSFKAAFEDGSFDSAEEVATLFTGLATAVGAVGVAWKKALPALAGTNFGTLFGWLLQGDDLATILALAFPKTAAIVTAVTTWVTGTFVPAITTALGAVATALGVSTGWAVAIVVAIVAAIGGALWVATHWDEVTTFFTETVPTWFSGVKDAVTEWWSNFDIGETVRGAMGDAKEWFSGVRDRVNEAWEDIIQDIDDIDWAGMGERTGRAVGEAFVNAKEWFSGIKDSVEEFFLEDLPLFFTEDVPQFFTETIPSVIESIKTSWNKFWGEKVPEFLSEMVNFFFVELPEWKEDMGEIGLEIIMGILEGIEGAWDEFWKGVKEWIDGFVEGFNDELEINSPSKVFEDIGRYIIEGLLSGISGKWEELKRWYSSNIAPKFTKEFWVGKFVGLKEGFVQTVKGMVNAAVDKLNQFIDWANDALKIDFDGLKNPLSGQWIIKPMSVQLATIPKIPYFAEGGFPNMGQMFIAREAGPELVGRIGSRSAVVNNDQIIEGVAAGVYRAVVQAMSDTSRGSDQNVNVYLDGKQIYASIKRTEAERGVSLMGNQLGYTY